MHGAVKRDFDWAVNKIQPLAIEQVYHKQWPSATLIELDKDRKSELARVLDIAGADKLIRYRDGGISFIGQRMRRYETVVGVNGKIKYDDFTLRRSRPSGRPTEAGKIVVAFQRNGLIAAFSAYGIVNRLEVGFERFRLFDFWLFCEMWLRGQFEPDGWKKNPDGTTFWHWRFKRFPEELWVYNSETFQYSLGL